MTFLPVARIAGHHAKGSLVETERVVTILAGIAMVAVPWLVVLKFLDVLRFKLGGF